MGVVRVSRARSSGAVVATWCDVDFGWVTLCRTHGGFAEGHPSGRVARSFASAPEVYCAACADIVRGR